MTCLVRVWSSSRKGDRGNVEQLFYHIGAWLEAIGPWAYVIAPLVMAAVSILPFPAEAPAMVNGALFGPWAGSLVTWCGAMLGAQISFELARRLGRPAVERLLRPSTIDRADGWVRRGGWPGMLLARFMPLIAFTALNWASGLTSVPRWRFVWTTAVGIVPGAIVFTASGWGIVVALERLPWVAVAIATVMLLYVGLRRWRNRSEV